MATGVSTRRDPRYALDGRAAQINFDFPFPHGKSWEGELTRISVAGIAFAIAGLPPGLQPGDKVRQITIRVGEIEIHGDLLVRNVSNDEKHRTVYGALMYPISDADQLRLNCLIEECTEG
ncbi:MAG: hypothetical protein GY716_14865 [bacterium]|nr:hypothetical protein [bacterium]